MNLKDVLEKNRKAKKKEAAKKAAKNVAVGAGIGAAIGVAAGVLLAPKSGKETREDIAAGAKDALETVKEKANETKNMVNAFIEERKAAKSAGEVESSEETKTEE